MLNILFVGIRNDIGGVEKSLLNLLEQLKDKEEYHIDVYLFAHKGNLYNSLRKYYYFYPEDKNLKLIGITTKEAFQMSMIYGVERLITGFISKYVSAWLAYRILARNVDIKKEYDVAISYQNSSPKSLYGGTNEFVLSKIKSKRKIAFIHSDMVAINLNTKYNHNIYGKFDKVVSVSESCRRIFNGLWPDLSAKSYVVKNGVDVRDILTKAGDGKAYDQSVLNIITVARLDPVKGLERMVKIFRKLKNEGFDFYWHIIGDGVSKESIQQDIVKENMQDNIFLYGSQSNPYWFMKNADLFLLPSIHECAPIVFSEAICLDLPIVSTNTLSAKEMVEERHVGIVCDNTDLCLYEALKSILADRTILKPFKTYMENGVFELTGEKEFCELVNNL